MPEHLSARRREALRLDLEDQQKVLIEDVYRLSRGLIHGKAVPEAFRCEVIKGGLDSRPIDGAMAERLDRDLARLHAVSRALASIDRPEFGRCVSCGELIPFDDLARDATRDRCAGSCGRA